jgi:hypothetical protein
LISENFYHDLLKIELIDAGFFPSEIARIWEEAPPEVLQICSAFFAIAIARGKSITEFLGNRQIMDREARRAEAHPDEQIHAVGEALLRLNSVLRQVSRPAS